MTICKYCCNPRPSVRTCYQVITHQCCLWCSGLFAAQFLCMSKSSCFMIDWFQLLRRHKPKMFLGMMVELHDQGVLSVDLTTSLLQVKSLAIWGLHFCYAFCYAFIVLNKCCLLGYCILEHLFAYFPTVTPYPQSSAQSVKQAEVKVWWINI